MEFKISSYTEKVLKDDVHEMERLNRVVPFTFDLLFRLKKEKFQFNKSNVGHSVNMHNDDKSIVAHIDSFGEICNCAIKLHDHKDLKRVFYEFDPSFDRIYLTLSLVDQPYPCHAQLNLEGNSRQALTQLLQEKEFEYKMS